MASLAFGSQGPSIPHLSKTEPLRDLRADVEVGFLALEQLVDSGHYASACLHLATKPTATDTVSIGSDVYEFGGVGTSHINVAIGAAVTNSRTNLVAAINTLGTKLVKAEVSTVPAAGVAISMADAVGGNKVLGASGSLVLAEALTDTTDTWDQANLSATGKSVGPAREASGRVVINATNVANPFVIALDFTPVSVEWHAYAATGAIKVTTATIAISGNNLLVDAAAGGTDLAATDFILWTARA